MGKDTWRLILRKNGKVVPERGGEDGWPMECDKETRKTAGDVLAALKDAAGCGVGGKGHWVFRDAFISSDGIGIILVITADEGFEQHFYLKVIPNHRGITIKVDSVGHPYRTPAMRAALLHALDIASK